MKDKFKKFVEEEIYNQLCYYKTDTIRVTATRFFLTAYEDDYEYVKRQICYFISSWEGPIYLNMLPDRHEFVVTVWEI